VWKLSLTRINFIFIFFHPHFRLHSGFGLTAAARESRVGAAWILPAQVLGMKFCREGAALAGEGRRGNPAFQLSDLKPGIASA
jgi:hypothetical protein